MLIDARHLEHLAAIIDHNTLQDAAVSLGTSQPALSRMIRKIEQRIGVSLFETGSRPLVVTEMGHRLADQGRAITAARTRAAQDIALSTRGMSGVLKIGAPPFLCERLVSDAIAAFFERRQDIEVQLVSDYFPDLERSILLNQIDIMICPIKLVVATKQNFRIEPLFRDEHVIVARKDHPLASKADITLEDLEGANWIGHAQRSMLRSDMATALTSIGVKNLKLGFHSESAGANFEMLRRTDFLTVLPKYALSKTQTESGLTSLPVRFAAATVTVGMMTLKQREPSVLLSTFQDHVRKFVEVSGMTRADSQASRLGDTA
ncbi:MAG: LysR family transcriptional regulator [Octadecabacter sp.]